MTWKEKIKKASKSELKSMLRLLREAREAGREAEKGLNYRWKILNSGGKGSFYDDAADGLSMNEIEQKIKRINKAIIDIEKIIGDLEADLYPTV
jgi:hypothetical protein